MLKEAFLSALITSSANPNSSEIILVETHQSHVQGHTIVNVETAESFKGRSRPAVISAGDVTVVN